MTTTRRFGATLFSPWRSKFTTLSQPSQVRMVEVVSDPRCPWCYVAHHRLRRAIEETGAGDSVVVRFAPFFLDDTLPVEGVDRRSYYRQRFGEAAMAQVDEQMAGVFEREGIGHAYVSEGTACSSLPAHRLLAYAERQYPDDVGLAERVASELFLRYFSACARDRTVDAGENIANIEVLTSVAASAGMDDTAAVRAFLEGDALTDDVVAAAARNRARGLSVPHVTINGAVELEGTPETAELAALLRSQPPATSPSEAAMVGSRDHGCGRAASPPEPLETSRHDVQAARRMRWRSANLLPRMLSMQAWPLQCPFEDSSPAFRRLDESSDTGFYGTPRLEHHLDAPARAALADHYGQCFQSVLDGDGGTAPSQEHAVPGDGEEEEEGITTRSLAILDLCSSWTSHYPDSASQLLASSRVAGVGMNESELAANEWLGRDSPGGSFHVQDLNIDPRLGHLGNESFDLATCSLSIDYLTKPLAVMHDLHRVLRPGGLAVISFSNRMFRSKAVEIWRDSDDSTRLWLVAAYFHYSSSWDDITVLDLSKDSSDPLFVVQAWKQ